MQIGSIHTRRLRCARKGTLHASTVPLRYARHHVRRSVFCGSLCRGPLWLVSRMIYFRHPGSHAGHCRVGIIIQDCSFVCLLHRLLPSGGTPFYPLSFFFFFQVGNYNDSAAEPVQPISGRSHSPNSAPFERVLSARHFHLANSVGTHSSALA